MAGSRVGWGGIVAFVGAIVAGSVGAEDAIDRLTLARVAAVHEAVEAFAAARKPLERGGDLHEYRCNLHVHSAFSHDSRGKIESIVAAAKRAGTDALLFTEHPAAHYDFVTDGHTGLVDGVLLVPGAETKGMLVYPRRTVPEERMDWNLDSLTGSEIYNTHADAKEETRLYAMMKNPLWLVQVKKVLDAYPQESLAAIFDPPSDYLKRFDELCAVYPHTGVSGNDAHENVGLRITLLEGDKVRMTDALDEELTVLDRAVVAAFTPIPADAQPGDLVFKLQLDPYEQSLRHVGTHVLATELSRDAIQEGLVKGRAFVAFDWIADARGFDFQAEDGNGRHEMGSHVALSDSPVLRGRAPLPGHWKVFNRGELVHEADGATFEWAPAAPGNHRVELWLDVADRPLPWVLANPIYIE